MRSIYCHLDHVQNQVGQTAELFFQANVIDKDQCSLFGVFEDYHQLLCLDFFYQSQDFYYLP